MRNNWSLVSQVRQLIAITCPGDREFGYSWFRAGIHRLQGDNKLDHSLLSAVMQESATECDENMKTLLNKEEQPDLAAGLNCQGDDDKWFDEKQQQQQQKDMLAELHGAIELYQEKERNYGELIEKCNQNRSELSREFLDLILQRAVSELLWWLNSCFLISNVDAAKRFINTGTIPGRQR